MQPNQRLIQTNTQIRQYSRLERVFAEEQHNLRITKTKLQFQFQAQKKDHYSELLKSKQEQLFQLKQQFNLQQLQKKNLHLEVQNQKQLTIESKMMTQEITQKGKKEVQRHLRQIHELNKEKTLLQKLLAQLKQHYKEKLQKLQKTTQQRNNAQFNRENDKILYKQENEKLRSLYQQEKFQHEMKVRQMKQDQLNYIETLKRTHRQQVQQLIQQNNQLKLLNRSFIHQ